MFEFKNLERDKRTLHEIFLDRDIEIIGMWQNKTTDIDKDTKIGTYGLCGCDCIVSIDNGKIFIAHYPPTNRIDLIDAYNKFIHNYPLSKTYIFTLGDYIQDMDNKWINTPKYKFNNLYPKDNIKVIPYSENQMIGFTMQGTVIYEDGKLFHEGCIVS